MARDDDRTNDAVLPPRPVAGVVPSQKEGASSAPPPRGAFRALANPNYRRYWLGNTVSLIGTWMQGTAQAWIVIELGKSGTALGTVIALQMAPVTLLSFFGGWLADRFPKRALLLGAQLGLLAHSLVFAGLFFAGHLHLDALYALSFFQGILFAIDKPARQSFVSELTGPGLLGNAVALSSLSFNSARLIGPALAGLLMARVGVGPVILVNSATFLAALAGLLLIDPRQLHGASGGGRAPRGGGAPGGLPAFLRANRLVAGVLAIVAVMGIFGYNFGVIIPLIAKIRLGLNADGFGFLSSAFGAGALAGALRTASLPSVDLRRLERWSVVFAASLGALGLAAQPGIAAALFFVTGFAGVSAMATANTLVQLNSPPELRGRVMSLYIILFIGMAPVGSLIAGQLADRAGVPATQGILAALCFAGVLACRLLVAAPKEQRV